MTTLGWSPSCECLDIVCLQDHPPGWKGINCPGPMEHQPPKPVPCTVLDPFAGSGTTLLVARKLGRRALGVELSPDYAALIPKRFGSLWGQLDLLTQGAV